MAPWFVLYKEYLLRSLTSKLPYVVWRATFHKRYCGHLTAFLYDEENTKPLKNKPKSRFPPYTKYTVTAIEALLAYFGLWHTLIENEKKKTGDGEENVRPAASIKLLKASPFSLLGKAAHTRLPSDTTPTFSDHGTYGFLCTRKSSHLFSSRLFSLSFLLRGTIFNRTKCC